MKSEKDNNVGTIMEKKQTHRYREQASGHQWGEGREAGQYRGEGLGGKKGYYGII